jgi:HEAT repeat protein
MYGTLTMDDTLIEQLSSLDMITRHQAQDQLVKLGSAVVEPLLESLSNCSGYRQRIAIIAVLANIGDMRATSALIWELETGNLGVRIMAAEALGNFPTPKVFNALCRCLTIEVVMVQIWIVESLGKLGDRRAVRLLAKVLHETGSPALQYSIIRVLGELGDPNAIPYVAEYINERDSFVRAIAQAALRRLSEGDGV